MSISSFCYSDSNLFVMTGFIYLIKNKENGKIYVGQTIGRVRQRWSCHCNPNNRSNSLITKAIIKYGKDRFEILVLETIQDENKNNLIDKLNMLEKSYIVALKSLAPYGYNIFHGGKNSKRSDSTKKKISDALKGRQSRKTWLGKSFSEEHKKNISKSSKWSKQLICIENQQIYGSITEASLKLRIPRSSLSQSLRNKGIYEGSFTLKYLGNKYV